MKSERQQYLDAMGIQVWQAKDAGGECSVNVNTESGSVDQSDWDVLEQQAMHCTLCDLCKTRTHVVFGVGNKQSDLLIIGEAPGANEDKQGEPFVGRAGMLLNAMLNAIGLKRSDIYIANILKCRPPQNRDPLPHEIESCTSYLQQQISLIQPKLIVAVGRIAAQYLLNTKDSMGKLRGNVYHYGEQSIPLLVTYHPAYLLRSPREKSKSYRDLLHMQTMIRN